MFTNSIAFSYDFNRIRTIYFDCIVKKSLYLNVFMKKKRILFFNIFNMVLFLMFRYVTHFLGKWHPIPLRFSPVSGSQSIGEYYTLSIGVEVKDNNPNKKITSKSEKRGLKKWRLAKITNKATNGTEWIWAHHSHIFSPASYTPLQKNPNRPNSYNLYKQNVCSVLAIKLSWVFVIT